MGPAAASREIARGQPASKSTTAVDHHVGGRVRMQRNMLGLSQTELGQRSGGVTFQQIQKYENGKNRIGASRLHLISRALNVPIEFFYEGMSEEGGTERGKSSSTALPGVSTFLATSDAVDLMKAFAGIKDRGVRRRIVKLAEELAKWEPSEKSRAKPMASNATGQRRR